MLCDPIDDSLPDSSVHEFTGFPPQEYWSGFSFSSLGCFPDPGIESRSPALQVDSLLSDPPGESDSTY